MATTPFPTEFTGPWRDLLRSTQDAQIDDFPNYHVFNPDSLLTTSRPRALHLGTGLHIFKRALLPALLEARTSIRFVTCYWADSPSLDAFRDTLLQIAARRRESKAGGVLKVSIGFSSRGLLQKLLHTASTDGYVYPPSEWTTLGLPDEGTLRDARIDLTVKTLFFTPFSVMHPKYLVVDETAAWVPSCNVSWERWLEGCVALEGNVVDKILTFHEHVWGQGSWSTFGDGQNTPPRDGASRISDTTAPRDESYAASHSASASRTLTLASGDAVPTIFLPSPHHRNPRFSFFPFLSRENPPMTPLNAALLTLFQQAKNQITILTPNVTSWPALEALLQSLSRGVNVQIRTSKDMMFIEQLVTAGTWTSRALGQFIKRYQALLRTAARRSSHDVESAAPAPGRLEVLYYKPSESRRAEDDEPVVSHFKMTMVDGEYVMFGSGNMDRASWWTSQEIGVLLYAPRFEGAALWEEVLSARTEVLYAST